jgi:hypothetical protein
MNRYRHRWQENRFASIASVVRAASVEIAERASSIAIGDARCSSHVARIRVRQLARAKGAHIREDQVARAIATKLRLILFAHNREG